MDHLVLRQSALCCRLHKPHNFRSCTARSKGILRHWHEIWRENLFHTLKYVIPIVSAFITRVTVMLQNSYKMLLWRTFLPKNCHVCADLSAPLISKSWHITLSSLPVVEQHRCVRPSKGSCVRLFKVLVTAKPKSECSNVETVTPAVNPTV